MRYTKSLVLLTGLLASTTGYLQAQDSGKLSIGDSLPDLELPQLINSAQQKLRTADFRDRLLILDFWGTTCATCIQKLPEMQGLQQEFGERIKVLAVTTEPEKKIAAFWKSNAYTRKLTLPSVVGDKQLSVLFPSRGIPHEVWIYKGVVIAITGHQYVDSRNIGRVLNGEMVSWAEKNDFISYDYGKKLFDPGHANGVGQKEAWSYAALSGFKRGVNSYASIGGHAITRDSVSRTLRLYFVNFPLYNLYFVMLRGIHSKEYARPYTTNEFMGNQVIWEVSDPNRYRFADGGEDYIQEWNIKNQVCYEYLAADTGQNDTQVYLAAIREMDRLMGLQVRWEKRMEEVYVVNRKAGLKKLGTIMASGITLDEIVTKLNKTEGQPYVYNVVPEMNFVKIAIGEKAIIDLILLHKALGQVGLELKKENREVEKMVFTSMENNIR